MMNQEDIFKKIGQILNELQDQYEFLAQNPKQLNELELELFLANANFLSDHVQIIRKINNNKTLKALPEHTEDYIEIVREEVIQEKELPLEPEEPKPSEEQQEIAEPVREELFKLDTESSKFEFLLNEQSSDKFDFEEKSVDDIFDRPLSKEEALIIAQKQKLKDGQSQQPVQQEQQPIKEDKDEVGPEPFLVAPTVTSEPVIDQVEEKMVLPPSPLGEPELNKIEEPEITINKEEVVKPVTDNLRPTLNDLLAGKNNQAGNLNEGSNKAVITDLKQSINLNEKLLYIKDLFNGYSLAYAEAIDLINKMPDFKTADAFLKSNYAIKNNWALKQSTVDQFYELLNQRFPVK